jgi:hypothetical protein
MSDITYTLAFVTINGTLMAQEQDVTVTRTTNSQAVSTVGLGYAGESPGAAMCTIDVENAVPQAGFEYDAGQSMLSLTPVKLFVLGPGGVPPQQLKFTGQIIQDTFGHGVNKAATYRFSARGSFVTWGA